MMGVEGEIPALPIQESPQKEDQFYEWQEQKKDLDKIHSIQDVFYYAFSGEKSWTRQRAKQIFSILPTEYKKSGYSDKAFVEGVKSALQEYFFDGNEFVKMGDDPREIKIRRQKEQWEKTEEGLKREQGVARKPSDAIRRPAVRRLPGNGLLLPLVGRRERPAPLDPPPSPSLFTRRRGETIPPQSFETNQRFYNVETLKAQLSPEVRREADFIASQFPPEWHGPLYRNALNASKSRHKFDRSQPLILTNLSLKTAAIYFPGRGVVFSDNFIGSGGIGNKGGANGTPLGSFRIEKGPSDRKFQYRMYVHGEEPQGRDFIVSDARQASDLDPAQYGNKKSHERYVRIHEWEGNPEECKTKGCFGFPGDIAQQLYITVGSKGGRMEAFVSS